MKKVIKRITAWLAVFALLLGFCAATSVETFAASNDFVIDSSGVLTGYNGVGGNLCN